jgi:hypothetical protein
MKVKKIKPFTVKKNLFNKLEILKQWDSKRSTTRMIIALNTLFKNS